MKYKWLPSSSVCWVSLVIAGKQGSIVSIEAGVLSEYRISSSVVAIRWSPDSTLFDVTWICKSVRELFAVLDLLESSLACERCRSCTRYGSSSDFANCPKLQKSFHDGESFLDRERKPYLLCRISNLCRGSPSHHHRGCWNSGILPR